MTENDHEARISKLEARMSIVWWVLTLAGTVLAGLSGKVLDWVTQGW